MITPPLSISARPTLTLYEPVMRIEITTQKMIDIPADHRRVTSVKLYIGRKNYANKMIIVD
jgi:hypothetical protein